MYYVAIMRDIIVHMSDLSAVCLKFILPHTISGGGCIPLIPPPLKGSAMTQILTVLQAR